MNALGNALRGVCFTRHDLTNDLNSTILFSAA